MDFPDVKQLKKLAATCRSVGIKTFKCGDFEFTLGDVVPYRPARKTSKATVVDSDNPPTEEQLSEEELLFWSTPSYPPNDPGNKQ